MSHPRMTTAQKLTRAKVQLVLMQPFFGTLCLRLKLLPGDLPTMATDGSRILYNPAFVDQLKPAELEGTLAHEVLHCALGHHCRRGSRDPGLWNEAADLAINPILIGNGFTLPAGALIDPAFANLSAEEIYARLLRKRSEENATSKQAQQQTNAGGGTANSPQATNGTAPPDPNPDSSSQRTPNQDGRTPGQAVGPISPRPGGFGEVWDTTDEQGHPASPAEMRRQMHEWGIAAEQALRSAKACGHEPAGVERPLSESRRSQQDWGAPGFRGSPSAQPAPTRPGLSQTHPYSGHEAEGSNEADRDCVACNRHYWGDVGDGRVCNLVSGIST